MTTRNARKQAAYREREKVKQERRKDEKSKADSELLLSFCKAFPGQMTVNIAPIEHEDYTEPVRVQIRFATELRREVAAFALERDMDIESLFDRLAVIIMDRAKPDHTLFLVE